MQFSKVLVSVNGDKSDEELVRLACSMSKKSKGKLYVVYVIQVERNLPLDAEMELETRIGEAVLDRAERIAHEHDCDIETELLQAREVGPAIVDEAVERGVDLIMMGLSYQKQFGEFTMGDAVPYVLRNAPCQVLAYREPIT